MAASDVSSASGNPPLAGFPGIVLLVGAGKMGGAMLEAWLRLGLDPARVVVREPHPPGRIRELTARGLSLNPAVVPDPRVVVLAVKPQTAPEVIPVLAGLITPATVVVSIMAGRTTDFLESALPAGTAIIRSMPNTPAALGRGITVARANPRVTSMQRDLADRLLRASGAVEWITDEKLLDAVTAVSGSGPAYVFLLAEALAGAGRRAGLSEALAAQLAVQTVIGAGRLLAEPGATPEVLRAQVTSPGGTTEAAVRVLESGGLRSLLSEAVQAAAERSRQLAAGGS